MSEQIPDGEARLLERLHAVDVQAPVHLHERVQAMADEASGGSRRGRRRGLGWRLGAAGAAAAAIAIVLVLALSGSGGGSEISLQHASALALGRATMPAPAESPAHHAQLSAAVDGVAFPYWGERFGWRAVGTGSGEIAGRPVTTVYYADEAGRRVGYAIVHGAPAPALSTAAGSVRWRHGTAYRVSRVGDAAVVTWVRDGHLCVIAGRGVPPVTLLALASWDDRATVS